MELLLAKTQIGDALTVEALLTENPNLKDVKDVYGNTPLHLAALEGHTNVIIVLLNFNANPCLLNDFGCTTLMCATEKGHCFAVKRLIESTYEDQETSTAFLINQPNKLTGQSPLAVASVYGNTSIVEILLSQTYIEINTQDLMGKTAIYQAVTNDYKDIVSLLLNSGADPNIPDKKKHTALMSASIRGLFDIVKMLVKFGSDVNAISEERTTPLEMAVRMNFFDITQYLIESGANLNVSDQLGNTPVMWAAQYGRSRLTELLIRAGCDIQCVDRRGRTLLHHTAFFGWTELVSELLQRGLNPCRQNRGGNTPIVLAIRNNHFQVVKLLLDYNSPLYCGGYCNTLWASLLSLALERGRRDICELLYKAGCNLERGAMKQMVKDIHPLHPSGVLDIDWINHVMESPRTLVNCCRIVIRKNMGRNLRQDTSNLMLPKSIQSFILLDDVRSDDDL